MTAKPFPISSSKTPEHAASPETRGPIRSSTIPARSGKTYRLFILHHQNARLLLHPPVHQHGAFIYDLGFRRDLITNKGLIEAIDLLYWDPKRHRPKRGATTPTRPGNLRRLIAVIQQLDFNYDLYGMRAHEILQLLPPEFDAWRPPPLLTRGGEGERQSISELTGTSNGLNVAKRSAGVSPAGSGASRPRPGKTPNSSS